MGGRDGLKHFTNSFCIRHYGGPFPLKEGGYIRVKSYVKTRNVRIAEVNWIKVLIKTAQFQLGEKS